MSIKSNRIVRGLFFFFKTTFSPAKRSFGKIGGNVIITPPSFFSNPSNVFLGNNIGLGPNAMISTTNAKFTIKGDCVIAEGLSVHTGNHARLRGHFVSDINESIKPSGYDKEIVIEKDVWIGCNVTLLSGVTIGRGSTIAAGAVVNKSIPPYCIAGGVPAKVIKYYWTVDDIIEHERQLYPENERFSREYLESIIDNYNG